MAGVDPTYEWYSREYLGGADGMGEDAFASALPEARARVRARLALFDCDALQEPELTAYRRAVCAACQAVDSPAVASYSAGKASETFADAATMGAGPAVERELAGSRLACLWAPGGAL